MKTGHLDKQKKHVLKKKCMITEQSHKWNQTENQIWSECILDKTIM
jgi:hypothetical protein